MNSKESYYSNKSLFKAISLFGGVQFIRMVAGVIQTKVVAIFIGAEGIGILSILKSIVAIIESISSVGLNITAVRELTLASKADDRTMFSKSYRILFIWSLASGLIGFLITIVLSPYLSLWSFGNSEYITTIILVSAALLINSLATFYNSTLQGLRLLKYLAQSAIFSTIISVLINLLLLYFFKKEGIVFSIVFSSLVTLIFSYYYSSKHKFSRIKLRLIDVWKGGSVMVKYGILITISGLITNLFLYFLKIYIVQFGGIAISGLYQAGLTIFESYFAMIFIAMATDYYPRLTSHTADNNKMVETVNQQAKMNLLILCPIILIFIPLVPFAVRILYSSEFLEIVPYVYCAIFGLIFKSASWSMGYVLFAKGNSKQLLINSVVFNVIFFSLHALMFNYYGLLGLGLAYGIYYFVHFVGVLYITNRLYEFRFSNNFFVFLSFILSFTIIDILVTLYVKSLFGYSIILLFVIISVVFLLLNIFDYHKLRNYFRIKA